MNTRAHPQDTTPPPEVAPEATSDTSQETPPSRPHRFSRWGWRGIWALADHVLFAGANFAVQLGLARYWLSEHEFGSFAVAYVIFLVVGVFHTALLTEPMMVFGPGRYRDRLPLYLGKLVGAHLLLTAIGSVILAAIGLQQMRYGDNALGVALCWLAVVQVFQLLPWLLRSACYIESKPWPAGVAGIIYLLVVLGLLISFDLLGMKGIPAAIASMGIASAVVTGFLLWILRVSLIEIIRPAGYREIIKDHWRYGRWATPTCIMRWIPEHMPVLATPLVLGYMASSSPDFESGGALKALMHLSVPFVLFVWALSTLLIPMLVRQRGTPGFAKLSWQMGTLFVAVPLFAWPFIGFFHEQIFAVIYAGRFGEHSHHLWLIGLIPVLVAIDCILHSQLKAVERPDRLFFGSVASSIVLVVLGLPMLAFWGISGILWAVLLSYIVQIMVLWFCSHHIIANASRPETEISQPIIDTNTISTPAQESP